MTDKKVLISILIPIYNVGRYIERCAISLFEQSCDEYVEFIFVDDCSPDDSVEKLRRVLADYPQRISQVRIITHDVNMGLSEARNTALLNAKGKYIMHVDSDDYIETDMVIQLLSKALEKDADMIVCDFNSVYQDRIVRMNVPVDSDKFRYLALLLKRRTPVNLWGRIIKRDILIKNNIFAVPGLNHGEDYAVVPRIVFYATSIIKVDKALYNYVRYNTESYTHHVDPKAIDDILLASRILVDFFTNVGIGSQLPLVESQAINAITLFYCSDRRYYEKIATVCSTMKIGTLKISFLHKCLLFLSQKGMYDMLYILIGMVNRLKFKMKRS